MQYETTYIETNGIKLHVVMAAFPNSGADGRNKSNR
jgi:hypothetical protein